MLIRERKLIEDRDIKGFRCNACNWKRSQLAPEAWEVHPRAAFDVHTCADFPLTSNQELQRIPDWENDERIRRMTALEESLKSSH